MVKYDSIVEKSLDIKIRGTHKELCGLIMRLYLDGYIDSNSDDLDDTVKYLRKIDKIFGFKEEK